ncbi:MAG: ABC transporter permease [Nitrososphaerales archaeon]
MSTRIPNSVRLAWRNLKVNMDPASLVVIIGLPAMYLIFLGTMFVSLVQNFEVNGVSYTYSSYLAPGIVAFQTVMGGSVGGGMLWLDRRFGMFSQILSGPFTRSQYLLGIIEATTAAVLAGSGVMMIISTPLGSAFHFSLPGIGLVLLNLVVGGVFFCSLMLFIAAKVDSNNTYNSIQILILFVINFVSDVFYPLTNSTPWILKYLSYINPLTYIADGVRAGFAQPSDVFKLWYPEELVVLIMETTLMLLLAYRTYSTVKISTS